MPYDSVLDKRGKMGKEMRYFRSFRKKAKTSFKKRLQTKQITKNCKNLSFRNFLHHLAAKFYLKTFFCDALKVGLSFIKKKQKMIY